MYGVERSREKHNAVGRGRYKYKHYAIYRRDRVVTTNTNSA
jgi:hypothetical protein